MPRPKGQSPQWLRQRAAVCGLQISVESRGDGYYRYTFADAEGRVHVTTKGMRQAKAFLSGVEAARRLAPS